MSIRNSAKGIIINSEKQILLVRCAGKEDDFFILPGGGQNHGEPLEAALIRECLEETGFLVEVGALFAVREYIGAHHEFAAFDADVHQIEFMFFAKVLEKQFEIPPQPDEKQKSFMWINLDDISKIPIYPKMLKEALQNKENFESVYWGDTN